MSFNLCFYCKLMSVLHVQVIVILKYNIYKYPWINA